MAEKTCEDIGKSGEAFVSPARIHDAAQLAGHALAMPLATLRHRQARLEAVRTELRLGADHPETTMRAAKADAMEALAGRIGDDIARQRLPRPALTDQAGLYGRVTRDGAPLPGVAVSALGDDGVTVVHSCTGRDGDYLLTLPPDQPLTIEIRNQKKRLFRDPEGVRYPPYRATHRDIEISMGKPVCPGDSPAAPAGQVGVPALVGLSERVAIGELGKVGLRPGKRTEREGEKAGLVVAQDPAAGASVAPDSAVHLTVSAKRWQAASGSVRVGGVASGAADVSGKPLQRAMQTVAKTGAEVVSVKVSTDGGKGATVQAIRADNAGRKVELEVSTGSGDAQMTSVMASVLATTREAAEMSLTGKTQTADWLKQRNLTNLDRVGEALELDDDALRGHLSLGPADPIDTVRGLLHAAVRLIKRI